MRIITGNFHLLPFNRQCRMYDGRIMLCKIFQIHFQVKMMTSGTATQCTILFDVPPINVLSSPSLIYHLFAISFRLWSLPVVNGVHLTPRIGDIAIQDNGSWENNEESNCFDEMRFILSLDNEQHGLEIDVNGISPYSTAI